MKRSTRLPRALRMLFVFLRIMTMIMAVFWSVMIGYSTWIQAHHGQIPGIVASVGEISLPVGRGAIALASDTAAPGSLILHSLRATLEADLCSTDTALVSALRWSVIPSMALVVVLSYVLFTALRNVCANLERGDVFNEENLRLVRRIGASLIAYSLVVVGLEFWASHVLGSYFGKHVALTCLGTRFPFPGGAGTLNFFSLPAGLLTPLGGFLVGCLVLVVAEAFRQGLNLETENDLTV